MSTEEFTSRGCGILTIGTAHEPASPVGVADAGTKLVRDALVGAGHQVVLQRAIDDDLTTIRYLLREWVDDIRVDVIVVVGGTGLDALNFAPEALSTLMTKSMPGFGELLRALVFQELGIVALETRAMAAVCHSTLVYVIPHITEAVAIAMQRLIVPQLQSRVPTERLRPRTLPPIRKPPNSPE